MWQQRDISGLLGLCSGTIIASGVAGLLIGLSIIPDMQALPIPLIISFFMKICVFWESFLEIFLSFPVPPASGNSFFTFIRCVLRYFPWRMDPGSC